MISTATEASPKDQEAGATTTVEVKAAGVEQKFTLSGAGSAGDDADLKSVPLNEIEAEIGRFPVPPMIGEVILPVRLGSSGDVHKVKHHNHP